MSFAAVPNYAPERRRIDWVRVASVSFCGGFWFLVLNALWVAL